MSESPENKAPASLPDDEETRLRAAALQNARSILLARQRAERDLLETKEALERKNEELSQQREWFEVALASIGDAVITTDTSGRVTFLNAAAESLTGWSRAEAYGHALESVLPIINENTRVPTVNPVIAVLREGSVVGHANHTVLIGRDGRETPVEESAAPIRDGKGRLLGAVLVLHDVSERRRAERRKDEFLAVLAHELRNPLAPIRQAATVLQAEDATDAQVRWSHDVIERQVQHMALLLDDLLDVSRITRHKLQLRRQWTALTDVVDVAVETARQALDSRGHELVLDLPPQPVELHADPVRLGQILASLLTNAAKYTDSGGTITLSASRDGTDVVLRVRDTGIGIESAMLEQIFEMFSQTAAAIDRAEGGLGIGLALVKGLVQLHGGTIEATSDGPGRGSEFTIRLPTGRKPMSQSRIAAAVDDGAASQPRRVLIADDNRDSAESIAMIFRIYGHDVTVVYDGEAAVAAFQELQPDFVLLDIGMPRLNGYDTARQIRRAAGGRAVTIIALTGWGQESDKERALEAGFDHHFTKPVDPEVLNQLLSA